MKYDRQRQRIGFSGVGQMPYRRDPRPQRRHEGGIFQSDTFQGHAFSGMGKSPQEPRWLPWVLVGGAVLVGGGIIWTAYRSRR